jgi:hypothetical protein
MGNINLAELVAGENEHEQSPCKFGNIIIGHACYCHNESDETPRKCPIWRNYGVENLGRWKKTSWDEEGCPFFESVKE